MARASAHSSDTAWRRRTFAIAAFMLIAWGTWACRSGADSPETRVRATIARAETLAEAKDLGGLKALLSDEYHDDAGQDKRAIMGLLFVHLRRHESIHLLTRIDRIEMSAPTQAYTTVFVAMAGRPIAAASELPALQADLYRFDLALSDEDGAWRVTRSAWRPAVVDDFLGSGPGG